MAEISKKEKKRRIISGLYEAFSQYKQCLLVKLENVSSNQVQQARVTLRQQKKGIMIVGKNTVVVKALNVIANPPKEGEKGFDIRDSWHYQNPAVLSLTDLLKGKVGLIFSNSPVHDIKPIIEGNRKPSAAKVGMVAPIDVTVQPGPTGMDPSQINFFHALNMSTKINKGQIEITKEFKVCTKGKKVGNSEAVLLAKLNIKPFSYGMEIQWVYDDGNVLGPEIFNMNPNEILDKFRAGANKIASISLAIGRPNQLSAPHLFINAFKSVAAIALQTGLKFKLLDNLSSSSTSAPTGGSTGGKTDAPKKVEKVEEKKPEKEEEAAADLGGMFDDF